MFIHREEFGMSRERREGLVGVADLIIAKQRNCPVGDIKPGSSFPTRFENAANKAYEEFEPAGAGPNASRDRFLSHRGHV